MWVPQSPHNTRSKGGRFLSSPPPSWCGISLNTLTNDPSLPILSLHVASVALSVATFTWHTSNAVRTARMLLKPLERRVQLERNAGCQSQTNYKGKNDKQKSKWMWNENVFFWFGEAERNRKEMVLAGDIGCLVTKHKPSQALTRARPSTRVWE